MARRWRRLLPLVFAGAWIATACWHTLKPLPEGTRIESAWQRIDSNQIRFIADITTADAYGRPILSQAIFDEILRIVGTAHEFLVLDYFLFNDRHGSLQNSNLPLRPLTQELREAILTRKRA